MTVNIRNYFFCQLTSGIIFFVKYVSKFFSHLVSQLCISEKTKLYMHVFCSMVVNSYICSVGRGGIFNKTFLD